MFLLATIVVYTGLGTEISEPGQQHAIGPKTPSEGHWKGMRKKSMFDPY